MTLSFPAGDLWRGLALPALLTLPAVFLAVFAILGTTDPAILYYSTLPRIAAALISGFLLGLGGAVFQRVFANPLAEPTLLGISGGAALSLALSLVFAPILWSHGYQPIALAGGALALIIVLAVAWGPRLSSQALVLAGIMVNLFCSAAYAALVLFNHDFLSNLLAWQAGSLQQSGWGPSIRLTILAGCVIGPLWLLERPLRLLALGDGAAASLGLSVRTTKLLLLILASLLAASVTAEFGQIGLIGLAAPAIGRILRRKPYSGLLTSALTGALLLLTTDQLMRLLSSLAGDLPVGAAAGLLAGPVLILLARRTTGSMPAAIPAPAIIRENGSRLIAILLLVLLLAFTFALLVGQGPQGWSLSGPQEFSLVVRWRLPALLASAGAGFCLSIAGFLLQKLFRNPLASPDLLGIGHGAGLALAIAFVLAPASGMGAKLTVTASGAAIAMLAVNLLGLRSRFEPARMLLIGVGLASTANAMLVLALAGGGQRGAALLGWFAGITAGTDMATAISACATGLICLALCLFLHRRIDLIALGDPTAASFGVPVRTTRFLGLGIAALATAAGTLVVGPISFIGLMVPHIAAMLGFRGTAGTVAASGIIGALLMTAAEGLSRNLAWPWPLSPSLLVALAGGPWFLWHLRRQTGHLS